MNGLERITLAVRAKRVGIASCAIALLATACSSDVPASDQAVATDELYATTYDTGLAYAAADPLDVGFYAAPITSSPALRASGASAAIDTVGAAAQAAAAVNTYYTPSGCATASASASVVTYTLANCTGPLNLKGISGTLTATYGANSSSNLQITLAASNLMVNGVAYTVNATAVGTANGDARSVVITSTTVSNASNQATRSGQSTFTWTKGSGCVSLNGTGTRNVNATSYQTTISNFAECSGQCPTAGTLMIQGPSSSINVTFDGSSSANISVSTGENGTFDLSC